MAAQILSLTDVSPADRVGEFVSVNAYILQLFAPLSFLGTIYGVVIQAIIDMTNLSELLDITPDVDDDANATKLEVKQVAIGAKVEFKNVTFSKTIFFINPPYVTARFIQTINRNPSPAPCFAPHAHT